MSLAVKARANRQRALAYIHDTKRTERPQALSFLAGLARRYRGAK